MKCLCHLSVHSATSEPPQHPPEEKDNLGKYQTKPDNIELPHLETQVPILCQSVPPSDYTPWMGGKTYVTNIQTKTKQDDDEKNGLVYNHDEARVLATVITTFNNHMEHIVEEHRQACMLSPIALRQESINLVIKPRHQLIKT